MASKRMQLVTLKTAGAGTIVAQVNAGTVRWIEPGVKAHERKEYELIVISPRRRGLRFAMGWLARLGV